MNKKEYISALSVLSAFAVVMLHTNRVFWAFDPISWTSANILECVFFFAVPVFFMITGCNLINYREKYTTGEYVKKRILKIGIPFISWTIIAIFVRLAMHNISLEDIGVTYLWDAFVNNSAMNIYWFFIPLFTVYLCIPVIALIPEKERKNAFLYIMAITFFFSILLPFLSGLVGLTYNNELYIPICGGYMFYVLAGYYFDNYPPSKLIRYIIYVLGFCGLLLHIFGTYFKSVEAGYIVGTYKGYLNVPCALYCIAIFVFFKSMDKTKFMHFLHKLVAPFVNLTFGIYLIHYYFIDAVEVFGIADIGSLAFRLLGSVVIFVVSAMLVKLIKLIPVLRNIVP